jgi:hypothetical protein
MYDCTPKWKLNLHGKWFLLSVQSRFQWISACRPASRSCRPNVVFATFSNPRPMEFERKNRAELHWERQAVVCRLPLFAPQDGCQTWTGVLLNCQCSCGLLALISTPPIVVAERYSSHR